MSLTFIAGSFTPIPTIDDEQSLSYEKHLKGIGEIISKQVKQVTHELSDSEINQIDRHFLCSTMLELPFTSGDVSLDVFIDTENPIPPTSFINTYECASWGYSLRHYLNQLNEESAHGQYLIFSILDANALRLSFWKENENWGDSGFGLCTVLLKVEQLETAKQAVTASCAQTWNATPEFATIIRRSTVGRDDLTLSLPFFPETIRQIFDKLLANHKKLPDRHPEWGHVFGSDPWLNVIQEGSEQGFRDKQSIMACSIALNGYYCFTEFDIDSSARCYMNEETRGVL